MSSSIVCSFQIHSKKPILRFESFYFHICIYLCLPPVSGRAGSTYTDARLSRYLSVGSQGLFKKALAVCDAKNSVLKMGENSRIRRKTLPISREYRTLSPLSFLFCKKLKVPNSKNFVSNFSKNKKRNLFFGHKNFLWQKNK